LPAEQYLQSYRFLTFQFQIYIHCHPSLPSNHWSRILKLLNGSIFFGSFLLNSVSRVTDQAHHWWDVVAGDVFGVTQAILMHSAAQRRF
jgi:hypothetical protein